MAHRPGTDDNHRRRPHIRKPGAVGVSRRRFLAGAGSAATLGLLASVPVACSSLGSTVTAPQLVPLGSPDRVLAAGREQRIPFGMVASEHSPSVADGTLVPVRLRRDGETIVETEVAARVVSHDHVGDVDPDHQHSDIQRYFALRATLPEPGIYDLEATFGSSTTGSVRSTLPVQAFAPEEIMVPLPGDPFDPPDTPTFDRPAGVDPLCSRFEPCPLHEHSAADVVAKGRPLALLVATPAFCQTAYCGPVVDTLVEAMAMLGPGASVIGVHAEVYANPLEVDGDYTDPAIELAPAVEAIGLAFEPSLFLVDGSGLLVDRIDNVFDVGEAFEALQSLDAGA